MKLLPRSSRRVSKLAQRRRKILYTKTGALLVALLALVGFLVYVADRPELQIKDISVEGNEVVTEDEITATVREVLSGKYLFLFPRSNVFIYPRSGIINALHAQFQRINDIKVSIPQLGMLAVVVTERSPTALWCTKLVDSTDRISPCYFLNDEGFIFAQAPDFTGNVFFQFYGDIQKDDPIGERYLAQNDEFHGVSTLVDAVRKLGLTPIAFNILDEHDAEITMEDSSRLIFGRTQNFSELVENLKSILATDELDTADGSVLDYIDLRFGNKVYFKFKE